MKLNKIPTCENEECNNPCCEAGPKTWGITIFGIEILVLNWNRMSYHKLCAECFTEEEQNSQWRDYEEVYNDGARRGYEEGLRERGF